MAGTQVWPQREHTASCLCGIQVLLVWPFPQNVVMLQSTSVTRYCCCPETCNLNDTRPKAPPWAWDCWTKKMPCTFLTWTWWGIGTDRTTASALRHPCQEQVVVSMCFLQTKTMKLLWLVTQPSLLVSEGCKTAHATCGSKLCPRQESTAFAWVINFSTSCPARLLASLWQLPTSVPSQDGAYAAYLHRKHGSYNFAEVRAEDFSILDWQTYRCFLCPSRDRSCWQLSVEPPAAHWSCPSPIEHLWRYSAFLGACMILCFGLWTDFPVSQHLQFPEQRLSNSSGPHLAMQIYIQMNDLTMSQGSQKA